ncbi:MAG: adenylate/guanylate cyclase domain-containing protein [Rhodocyclaceae bacterium]|nr:MAG: adenylate/guanylate cyclase domain-containing protein [Rhodocyclaceae bacterium]
MAHWSGVFKKHLTRFVFGGLCVFLLFGHSARFWDVPFITLLEHHIYDSKLRRFMPETVDQQVVIVDIDEKSLAELGRWPWNRKLLSELVVRLVDDYQVKVLGFDVVFAEPDESSGLGVLEDLGRTHFRNDANYHRVLGELRPQLDYDGLFAASLQGRPVVLGYYFSSLINAEKSGLLPPPVFGPEVFRDRGIYPVGWDGYGANLGRFQSVATAAGHFNPLVDPDGSSRRVPMLVEYKGNFYQSLSLAVLRTALGQTRLEIGSSDKTRLVNELTIRWPDGDLKIPVDENLAVAVPYRGWERSFPYVSAVDVKNGQIPKEQLAGRIVLIGASAPGLNDLRVTPVGAAYPGVEVHANLIAGMLSGTVKHRPEYATGFDSVQIVLVGGLLTLLLPLLSPVRAALATGAALLLVLGFNLVSWQIGQVILPVAAVIVLILLLFAYNMSWGYFVESRAKRQFADLFGQYVPTALVEEMAKDPERYSMEGRNGNLTVLFADIRGFTSLSEGMKPQELAHMMNVYLDTMTQVIQSRLGTLDKYIGDAVMAFWGAPVPDSLHACNAIQAALEMQLAVRGLAPTFAAKGWPALQIGIGINTGAMTVGDMGSTIRKAYTVLGDPVNLASRLEGITKNYGVGIVVGEETCKAATMFTYRELDRVRVKGKEGAVTIFEPLGIESELPKDQVRELRLWKEVLRLYRAQDWDQAELQLYNLLKLSPDCALYQLYMRRIAEMRKVALPADWDGVTVFETK